MFLTLGVMLEPGNPNLCGPIPQGLPVFTNDSGGQQVFSLPYSCSGAPLSASAPAPAALEPAAAAPAPADGGEFPPYDALFVQSDFRVQSLLDCVSGACLEIMADSSPESCLSSTGKIFSST